MPNCKICGRPVTTAPVYHPECLEAATVKRCGNCDKTDGLCYASDPPKVKCTITGEFYHYDDMCDIQKTTAELIRTMTDENPVSKWISVKDRLPEPGVFVLVIANGKPRKNITLDRAYVLAEYDPEGWILEMWPEWMEANITHWMPLPEPPEKENYGQTE